MADKKKHPKKAALRPGTPVGAADFIPPEDGLGERVLMLRTQKGLSHESLSALSKLADPAGVGISRTTIRGYEFGSFKPGARELRILSKALQVSPSWLLLGETPNQAESIKDESPAHSEVTQLMMAFVALPEPERAALKTLAFSLLKYKIGEVDYRKLMGFGGDLGNMVADAYKNSGIGLGDSVIDMVKEQIDNQWPKEKT